MVTRKEINASKERQKKAKKKFGEEQAVRDSKKGKEKVKLEPKKKGVVRRVIDKVKEGRAKAKKKRPKLTKGLEVSAGVLGAGAAALGAVALAPGALGVGAATVGSRAVVSGTVSAHKLVTTGQGAEKLLGIGVRTAVRNFVGRAPKSGVDKLFKAGGNLAKNAPVAARYASNTKSAGLTKSLFLKAGMGVGAAGITLGAIGTYPFAGFIKEEAVQQTGFAFSSAERNNDVEGMELAIQATREIINSAPSIMSKIPYANILKELRGYFRAVEAKLIQDERTLAIKKEEIADPEETFEESQAAARQTKLEQRKRDSEYFALIREGRFEEAEELLNQELEGGN